MPSLKQGAREEKVSPRPIKGVPPEPFELIDQKLEENGRILEGFCAVPESTEKFLKQAGKRLCLDFSHAILSAVIEKMPDYNAFIKPYLKMKPEHFHFSDVLIKEEKDHLHLGEGNLDIGYYKKIFPENSEITLETRNNAETLLEDIRILKSP